jgi:hypothetical protein
LSTHKGYSSGLVTPSWNSEYNFDSETIYKKMCMFICVNIATIPLSFQHVVQQQFCLAIDCIHGPRRQT